MDIRESFTFKLNGKKVTVHVPPAKPLLHVLREDLNVTGPKPGCEAGECGSCTVLLDGSPVASCLVLVAQVQGREITTVEGLGTGSSLDIIQKAFLEEGVVQCGYCIPGMLMAAKALLKEGHKVDEEGIKEYMAGNICRCGSYQRVMEAVKRALQLG
jgi:aerobic-type carbon monoxide dehydrogenase small subunit (CoxS/CutS family)